MRSTDTTSTARGAFSFTAKLAHSSGSVEIAARPLMRMVSPQPGMRKSSATRGSKRMLRRLSMRLLPRRSGTSSVFSSWMRTLSLLRGKELPAVVSGDGDIEDDPRLHRRGKARAGEMLGAAELTGFGQGAMPAAHLRVEMTAQRRLAFFAQPPGAVLDHLAPDLRHARGGRAGPRRERKDVEMREPACIDEIERALEHVLGLGREPGDDVAAEDDVRPQSPHRIAEGDGVGT